MDRIEGWETKAMRRWFRFKRKEDETLAGYCSRTARAAKNDLDKDVTPVRSETTAESMWRAMGWACDTRPIAVSKNAKYAFA